jgi:hypothetical protein
MCAPFSASPAVDFVTITDSSFVACTPKLLLNIISHEEAEGCNFVF